MDKRVKVAVWIGVFVLFIAGSVLLYNNLIRKVSPSGNLAETAQPEVEGDAPEGIGEEERTKAPDITVTDTDGNEAKLSDLQGKPTVLNFWASWCPPCKAEMPEFDKIYAELGDEVNFMMVDLVDEDGKETVENGTAFIEEQGYRFPVYFDQVGDVFGMAGYTYSVRSIPTTYFIDSEGYLVTYASGQLNEDLLRQGIAMITE